MKNKHRIFIAINLPEDIKKELGFYIGKWPDLPAKWTDKDNLHITLEFLGDLTDAEVADTCKVAGEIARKHSPFSIILEKICYGGSGQRGQSRDSPWTVPGLSPRMIWAVGEKSKELSALKNDLQKSLVEEMGYRSENRGFAPHITLARIKEWEFKRIEPEERPEVNESIDLVFTVESIEIMESELKRSGPVYTILESCRL